MNLYRALAATICLDCTGFVVVEHYEESGINKDTLQ